MNWMKRFNKTLQFIEENITEDITSSDIERITFTSYHHFQRMFNILSGLTVTEYIRKRRLSKAAEELISGNDKVIDIAYKYRYKTPEAFTKAFKQYHSVNPSDVRKNSSAVKLFPKLTFQLIVKGGREMEYQILKKGNLNFVGYEIDVSALNGENFKTIPAFWQEIMQDGRFGKLFEAADDLGIVGICYDWRLEENKFKYMIGVRNQNIEIEDTVKVSFDDDVFASFKCEGSLPSSVQRTTEFIYQEWFPQSEYEHSSGPELEIYPKGDTNSEDYVCYYLVPVKQKK